MQPDQGSLIGHVVVGLVSLGLLGFIGYKVVQALAVFVNTLEGRPEPAIEDEDETE